MRYSSWRRWLPVDIKHHLISLRYINNTNCDFLTDNGEEYSVWCLKRGRTWRHMRNESLQLNNIQTIDHLVWANSLLKYPTGYCWVLNFFFQVDRYSREMWVFLFINYFFLHSPPQLPLGILFFYNFFCT